MPLVLKGTHAPGQADRRYYMIRVQVDGKRFTLSSGSRDRNYALKKEQEIVDALRANPELSKAQLSELLNGSGHRRHQAALKASAPLTIDEAIQHCLKSNDIWRKIKSHKQSAINANHFKNRFGAERVIATLTDKDMIEWSQVLLQNGYAQGTVDRILATTARILREARTLPNGPRQTPNIPFSRQLNIRMYVFSPEDERKLFDAISARDSVSRTPGDGALIRNLCEVLVESGLRVGEALRLRWSDIVLHKGAQDGLIRLWRADELKNGRTRTVPMTALCRNALEACRGAHPDGPFMTITKDRLRVVWGKAKKAAKLTDKDCVPHSLRHTCATRLLEVTGDIQLVSKWLGHTNIQTTARIYAHVQTHRMVNAAELLDAARGTTSN